MGGRWAAAGALVLAGCAAGSGAPSAGPVSTLGVDRAPGAAGGAVSAPAGGSVRRLDLGRIPRDGTAVVRVQPGEGSFLFTAAAADGDLEVSLAVADVTGPSGASVVPDASLLANPAEVSVLVTAPGGLAPGDYQVLLEASVPTVASATVKPFAAGPQRIDVILWDATRSGRPAKDPDGSARLVRTRGTDALGGVGLGVGSVGVLRAPPPTVRSFSRLRLPSSGTERRLRELCRAMWAGAGRAPALHVVLVDEILDRTAKDTDLFGSSAAVPGATMLEGSSTSCAAVAVGGEGGLAAQTSTMWHEAGHLLGLFHTSEEDGTEWDPIDDTPRCTKAQDADHDGYLLAEECASLDGQNLMFHDTDGVGLTPGQAAVLRASPLFR